MRAIYVLAAAAPALAAASLDAAATGGVYFSSTTRDAAACARMCADDGLCMAWSFQQDGVCDLRATAPAEPNGAAYGWSPRAPHALRLAASEAPAAPAPAPTTREALTVTRAEDAVSRLLLGGLEEDDSGLRN